MLGIDVEDGRVKRVRTSRGDVEADVVVIACGVWSPRIARMAGASIPLTPAVHQMIDVGPVPRFLTSKTAVDFPIVRDMDTNMYERQDGQGLEVGSYAHRPILHEPDEIPSIEESSLTPTELPFTQEDFELQLEHALQLVPEVLGDESVGIKYAINGLLSLTPDGLPLLGETPEVKGLWSAAAVWVKEGPGVGRAVAEWMTHGESEIDLQSSDVARFYPRAAHARAREGPRVGGLQQDVRDRPPGRAVGVEPRRSRVAVLRAGAGARRRLLRGGGVGAAALVRVERGARRGVRRAAARARVGRALVVADHQRRASRDARPRGDVRPDGVLRSSTSSAPDALESVQKVAARQMNVPDGRVIYTPVLTPSGGFKSDLTIMKMDDERFRVVTGGAHGMADKKWFADNLADDARDRGSHVDAVHASASGARGRATSSRRSRATTSRTRASRSARGRTLDVDGLEVLASRISYVGDLGWELYVPMERRREAVGRGVGGGAAARRRARRHRRVRHDRPAREGVPRVRLRARRGLHRRRGRHGVVEGEGRGLRRQGGAPRAPRGASRSAKLCTLTIDDHTSTSGMKRYPLGREPVTLPRRHAARPTRTAAARTSPPTGAAPSVGKHIVMSYLPPEHANEGEQLAVEYMTELYPATVDDRRLDADLRSGERENPLVRILVCVKRVPITGGKMVLTADEQALETKHLGFTISPHEECAVEEAVRIVEAGGGEVVVLTLGPAEAEEQLRDCMAIGADRGILLKTDGRSGTRRRRRRRSSTRSAARSRST